MKDNDNSFEILVRSSKKFATIRELSVKTKTLNSRAELLSRTIYER
jgi:hypothetical protein